MSQQYENCRIHSLEKARLILDCFLDKDEIGLSELSKTLGWNKSTVFALADSLKSVGFLLQIPENGKYRLGYGLLQLSSRISLDIKSAARPFMEELSAKYKENINLTGYQDTEITYLDQIESLYAVRVAGGVGVRMELSSSAVGKAILSALPDEDMLALVDRLPLTRFTDHTITDKESLLREIALTKERGYGINCSESWEDVYTVGVAILNVSGRPIGGLSIDGPLNRMVSGRLQAQIASDLKAAASGIQTALYHI